MVVANAVAALAEIGRDDFMNRNTGLHISFIQSLRTLGPIFFSIPQFFSIFRTVIGFQKRTSPFDYPWVKTVENISKYLKNSKKG